MRSAILVALATSLGLTCAETFLGFNSGATTDSRKVKKQADFKKEFETAQKLRNSPGIFNSVRLYTNIQPDTTDTPIEAFPAAVETNTKILLGLWCSGTTSIANEISALTKAVSQYGRNFTDLVVGISVGSEDLYRVSESGIQNEAGVGQDAATILGFIRDVRDAIEGTPLSEVPVGHVDTWTAWVNESNSEVIENVDFIGTNLFPYYEDDKGNAISNASNVFNDALNRTKNAAGEKPVWITETGYPYRGPAWGQAQATVDNAKTYWDTVGCSLFGRENVWWYALRDSNPDNQAKFAITEDLSETARFNLTCPTNSGAPAPINDAVKPSAGAVTSVSLINTVAVVVSLTFAFAASVA
jgi:glucan endo-1,3-beta-D-glucosidase